MTNAISWFEIYVNDMNRASKFYEGVFKIELVTMKTPISVGQFEMRGFPGSMSSYGANGSLVKMKGFSAGNVSVIIYFECEDCASEESRVVEFGGKIEKSKFSIDEFGFISLIVDSEGNMIGLHSMK